MTRTISPRWYDGAAIAIYIAIAAATLLHHEPSADEAQAWLLARDLGWFRLIFSELRYEGHPGLWYSILWIAIHWFHAAYPALGWIGLACAASGAAILIFLAPFPRPLKYLIAFSFYFLYQYAVIARSYNLLPPLAFLAAAFYRRRALLPFTVTLILMSNVSVHGAVIALALAAGYGWHRFRAFSYLLFSATALFLLIVLWPPSGTIGLHDTGALTVAGRLALSLAGIGLAFSNSFPLSFAIAGALYVWCAKRRVLWIYLISLAGTALVYGFLRGAAHHTGIPEVGALTALWCGWPSDCEVSAFSPGERRWNSASIAGLCLLFAYQWSWSWSAIRYDWEFPYSGARAAAAWLKSAGADRRSIDCFSYNSVAILPYFDSNICSNLQTPEGFSFFHSTVETRVRATLNAANLKSTWAVAGVSLPEQIPAIEGFMANSGYIMMKVADGTLVSHSNALSGKQTYLIFRRTPGY